MEWIPCEERLPKAEHGESESVLATCMHKSDYPDGAIWIRLLYFNGGNWCYPTGECYSSLVIAWMPLPQPYTADRKTENSSEKPNKCEPQKDCKYWVYNFNGCSRNPCTEPWYATDFCNYGEKK